jgi:hypothetical protein
MNEFEKIWRLMDGFCECDMDFDAFEKEFDRHFKAMEQEFYREFFMTLKKTVELCQSMECCEPPETLHITLLELIEKTPQKGLKKKTSRKKRPK